MKSGVWVAGAACLAALLAAPSVSAQSASAAAVSTATDDLAPPLPPAVVSRSGTDRVIVRATRITEAIVLDGRLNDEIYQRVAFISDFVQQEPHEGQPATEKTDVWLFFDDRNIYVAARCWDSHPEREVAKEMRRDNNALGDNDLFQVAFDTFHDRRNAFSFLVNRSGGLTDAQTTDERDYNRDWNTVWDARMARFEQGWTVEMVIPFKSLRYQAGREQTWGVNFRRTIGWKNEATFLTRIPAALGRRGLNKISSAGTLVGIEAPPARRLLEVKPYGTSDLTTDRLAAPPLSNDVGWDGGVDLKMGVTKGLTADVTVNTDFAQVEVDEQQVNLTRFNTFFAEKRDFFLEGQGIFGFGGVRNNMRDQTGPGGQNSGNNPNTIEMPNLFFSRRIGLDSGQLVPIRAGGRVTGKAGRYSVGIIDIETGETPDAKIRANNFGVVRVKRDVLRRSAIGALITNRSIATSGIGSNQLYGLDGTFSFFENLNINTYIAKTATNGLNGSDTSYRAQLDYAADKYGLQLEQLFLDDQFDPQVGFTSRRAFRRSAAYVRYSPRPKGNKFLRKIIYDATYAYTTSPNGDLQSRYAEAAVRADMQSGDTWAVEFTENYEALSRPFAISKGVTLPIGGYGFPEARVLYQLGPQRRTSGVIKVAHGRFYDGTRTELATTRGRIGVTAGISVEPGLTVDWVDLPEGRFTTTVASVRTTWTLSPRMVLGALTQYVSSTRSIGTNVRFRWEYIPGSDIFVVYNDNRDSNLGSYLLQSRSFVIKVTRLLRR